MICLYQNSIVRRCSSFVGSLVYDFRCFVKEKCFIDVNCLLKRHLFIQFTWFTICTSIVCGGYEGGGLKINVPRGDFIFFTQWILIQKRYTMLKRLKGYNLVNFTKTTCYETVVKFFLFFFFLFFYCSNYPNKTGVQQNSLHSFISMRKLCMCVVAGVAMTIYLTTPFIKYTKRNNNKKRIGITSTRKRKKKQHARRHTHTHRKEEKKSPERMTFV